MAITNLPVDNLDGGPPSAVLGRVAVPGLLFSDPMELAFDDRPAAGRPVARPGGQAAAEARAQPRAQPRQEEEQAGAVGDEARRQQKRAGDKQAQAVEHLGEGQAALGQFVARAVQRRQALVAQQAGAGKGRRDDDK